MATRGGNQQGGPGPMPTEVEASLAIVAGDPEAVAAELAGLRELGRYRLLPRPEKRIRDIYLDTPDGQLLRHLVSVRLRESNDKVLVTLKGDDPSAGAGIKVRRELELPWSEDALAQVLAALAGDGIRLLDEPTEREASPLARLIARGLVVVQERSTRRAVRDVVAAEDATAAPLAEMVIDRVHFGAAGRTIRHSEVEIELKAGQDRALIGEMQETLCALLPGRLLPWSVAKLTLGMWLERMLAQGALEPYLAADGRLLPEAYPAILAHGRAHAS